MLTPRRRRYVGLQVGWLLGVLLALVLLEAFALGALILLGVLGAVVLDDLLTPVDVEPRWRGPRRSLAAIGLLAALGVVVVRTAQLLVPGVLP